MRQRKKRRDPLIIENVEILDAGAEGKCLAKIDNKILFVPFVAPGDIVDVLITKSKASFMEGRVVKLIKESEARIKPMCSHFGVCGGCKWQILSYKNQLSYKQKQVCDQLERIGKIEINQIDPILASQEEFYYRNKLEFTFSNKRWFLEEELHSTNKKSSNEALGFHIPGLFDKVLDVSFCHLQAEPSNSIRNKIREYAHQNAFSFYDIKNHKGLLRNLIIRNSSSGDQMVILSFGENEEEKIHSLLSFLVNEFPQITSLQYVINEKMNDTIHDLNIITFHGEPFIIEKMPAFKAEYPELVFKIGPKSFYQTNSKQAHQLYKRAAELANFSGEEIVYDLYTGTGTIANFIAPYVNQVVGIEYVEDSVREAIENSKINGIKNTSFFAGDMSKILNEQFISEQGIPDIVITDPPRSGMHETVIKQLLNSKARKIIYISCNPATQARDIHLLSEKYIAIRSQAVDMFPQTHHVENIVELLLK